MRTAFPKLIEWLEEKPDLRYAEIQCHPGYGTPGFQIKLYERDPSALVDASEQKSVTEKGELSAAYTAVLKALARWEAGQFDAIVVATRRAATDDSGIHKKGEK